MTVQLLVKPAQSGSASILVDGKQIAAFDGYSPSKTYTVIKCPYTLPDKNQHQIAVQVKGIKSQSRSNTYVVLDNFIVNP